LDTDALAEGFTIVPGVLAAADCESLAMDAASTVIAGSGSRRLLSQDWCQSLAVRLRANSKLAGLLPSHYVAVQCTYFSKSSSHNWLVPIHQDLSIPVAARVNVPVLRGWSEKEGEPLNLGDALVLRPLLLHSSSKASGSGMRRVLHFLFGPPELPYGLRWQHAV
jgi:hypothetical protein